MATVVITIFVIKFCFYKMDAAIAVRRRQRVSSRREKRWSMNSQRLEEIVAELMKPISDARRSFDTDLSALLEEYLTEAGLHALEQEDSDSGQGAVRGTGYVVPNFAELALLLQQSANIYGRKVDCLHARVLSVCDALHAASELANTSVEEATLEAGGAAGGGGRRRAAGGPAAGGPAAGFAWIALAGCPAAARDEAGSRPPPTLPRHFAELQPRAASARPPLTDLAGDHIGFAADYYVLCRLQGGMLLEELEELEQAASAEPEPRAPALLELQAALMARGPAAPGPPAGPGPPPPGSPAGPASPPPVPRATSSPLPPPAPPSMLLDSLKKRRKRHSDDRIEEIAGTTIKMMIIKAASQLALVAPRSEAPAPRWAPVVASRARRILQLRRRLPAPEKEFKGFDFGRAEDIGGFAGWSAAEGSAARGSAARGPAARGPAARGSAGSGRGSLPGADDSDDDGFFELSSLGDSDASRHEELGPAADCGAAPVRELAARVLAALVPRAQHTPHTPHTPLARVLAAAHHHHDVSKLFLATLFLANAGNVEIIPGPPLSMNSCSLRLVSDDHSRYCAAARDELAPPHAPPSLQAPPRLEAPPSSHAPPPR